jgi:hypothetical protein
MVKINNKYYKNFAVEIKQFSDIEITTSDGKRTVKVKKNKRKRNESNKIEKEARMKQN